MVIDTVELLLNKIGGLVDEEIPKALILYKASREAFLSGDVGRAQKIKRLNYLLHNSEVPYTAEIGKNTIFAYGGIGVIIHGAAKIGERANIGSGVTIGGDHSGVPFIGDDVYLASGCKIIGGITIGHGAIIGSNAVVRKSVNSFEVVGGLPAKKLSEVTRENFDRYSGYYWCKGSRDGINSFLNWYFPMR